MPSEISGLPAALFTSDPSGSSQGQQADEMGQDTFLKLLTTQLQNQDPTSPMANEEFIAQLATFSSVEQLTAMRSTMESAVMGITSLNNASMASLLGTQVTAAKGAFHYDGKGDQALHFDASAPTTGGTVRVRDADGTVVAQFDLGSHPAGRGELAWDGRGLDGQRLEEGDYTFEIEATGPDGSPVDVMELLVGEVTEMDYTGGTPRPSVDGIPVEIGDLLVLQSPPE